MWHVGARDNWRGGCIFPRMLGPYIRPGADGGRWLVIGQRGLGEFWNATGTIEIKRRRFEGELDENDMQTVGTRVAEDALRHFPAA